jgi:DNA-binding transcriptional MerR regulator
MAEAVEGVMCSTVADLARLTGRTTRTIERWWRQGVIPEPEHRNEKDWKLWTPQQAQQVLEVAIQRRKIPVEDE